MTMLTDPFGRHVTYLRISLTDRCNLRCAYCMPVQGLRGLPKPELLREDEIVRVAQTAINLGMTKIRLTGGEPLVRPGIVNLVQRLASIPGIADLSLTTNGVLLEKLAGPLGQAGLQRVNVSLDTLDVERFQRITRFGDFERVWNGILAAEQAGLTPIKLNAVIIRGFNDDELEPLALLTCVYPWHVRFIEIMPIGNHQSWGVGLPAPHERYVSVQEMHAGLSHLSLQPIAQTTGNGPARRFRIPGALGTVGFISPLGEHFCQDCNRLRLTADGKLRSCLVAPTEVSLREALMNELSLGDLFRRAVACKPLHHDLRAAVPSSSQCGMSQLGG